MTLPQLHGVVPILVTPFDDRGRIDPESLQRLVEFNIEAGVHGLGIALGSEIVKLTDAERDQVIGTVVDQARGRIPVVVNTGASGYDLAVAYSRRAQELGAAAVMCTPPVVGIAASEVLGYFRAISDSVRIPVFIQDTSTTPVPATQIRAIGEACERVRYCKVESTPPPKRVYDAVAASDGLVAIFGGAAGHFLLQELRRGSIGTMPWPSTPRAFVQVWDHWQAGDTAAALATFERDIAPLLRLGAQSLGSGHVIHKEILRRQGVIATAFVRRPTEALDPITQQELDDACERLGFKPL